MIRPTNLHMLIGGATPEEANVIERILSEKINLEESLIQLSWYWPVKIVFSQPICIRRPVRRIISKPDEKGWSTVTIKKYNENTEHIFKSGFFKGESGCLAYSIKRGFNHGFILPVSKITYYEPVIQRKRNAPTN